MCVMVRYTIAGNIYAQSPELSLCRRARSSAMVIAPSLCENAVMHSPPRSAHRLLVRDRN